MGREKKERRERGRWREGEGEGERERERERGKEGEGERERGRGREGERERGRGGGNTPGPLWSAVAAVGTEFIARDGVQFLGNIHPTLGFAEEQTQSKLAVRRLMSTPNGLGMRVRDGELAHNTLLCTPGRGSSRFMPGVSPLCTPG